MQILKYLEPHTYADITNDLPEDFGCSDYMEEYYDLYSSLPNNLETSDFPLLNIYDLSRKGKAQNKLPRYVVEVLYGEGDFIVFSNSIKLIDYLCSIMTMIEYERRDAIEFSKRNQRDRQSDDQSDGY